MIIWTHSLALAFGLALDPQGVSFEEQIVYPPQPWLHTNFGYHITLGNVNGDENIDLAVAYPLLDDARGGGYVFLGPEFTQTTKITSPTLVPAQGLTYNGDNLGTGAWVLSDVNADGYGDLIAGADLAYGYLPGQAQIGRALVFLGPMMVQAQDLIPPFPSSKGQFFGAFGDVGDVTNDGIVDIIISTPNYVEQGAPGRICIYDGASGFGSAPICVMPTPGSVLTNAWGTGLLVEDFDGDGGKDILLTQGVLQPYMSTVAYLRNGLTNGLGYVPWAFLSTAHLDAPEKMFQFVDVNGDGVRDLLQHARHNQAQGAGRLLIQYGPTLQSATILNGSSESSSDAFGRTVGVGDVDRDGHVDLAVGQWGLDIPGTAGGSLDVGRMTLFFGPTFTQMMEFDGTYHSVQFGASVAVADTDGDGFAEVFCSEKQWGPGRVHIYRHHTLRLTGPTEVSVTSGASVPMSIEVGKLSANSPYLMLMSATGSTPGLDVPYAGGSVHVPLTFDALTSAGLSIVNTPLCAGFLGTLDGNGNATSTLTIPGGAISPVFAGLSITCAAVVGDAQGNLAYATRAVTIPLVP